MTPTPIPDLRERLIRAMEVGYYLRPYKPDQEMKAFKKAAIQNIVDCILASPEWAEIKKWYIKLGEDLGLTRAVRMALDCDGEHVANQIAGMTSLNDYVAELLAAGEARGLERAAEIANAYPEAGRYDHSNEAVVWNAAQNIKDDIRALRPSPALAAVPREEYERLRALAQQIAKTIEHDRMATQLQLDARAVLSETGP